ncbi:1-deoxy-D-xylulose 5-phosphate synthase [Plasmodium sp. gorilla clade G2]|uniref:1-deoxy-D-xylulose 5-phosphate synthase n=1 Tax=Plasmodium sp. gorilla clade G2 TaxID=880535 RepID=UPI000D204EA0|nr:1-deoxy-D-xylulose 5-phosphate synthase [Plasmodium sp. gorilla clade G2]SOV18010.1 1-deoxy-D-xylulose 5-phosphate synthase [Plasmodium sp. gorilla clade G2]
MIFNYVFFKNFVLVVLYIVLIIYINLNGVNNKNQIKKEKIYIKKFNRLSNQNSLCSSKNKIACFFNISNDDNKNTIYNYNINVKNDDINPLFKNNYSNKLYMDKRKNINNVISTNKISESISNICSINQKENKNKRNKQRCLTQCHTYNLSNEQKKRADDNNSNNKKNFNLLFINYFNLKGMKNSLLNKDNFFYCREKKLSFLHKAYKKKNGTYQNYSLKRKSNRDSNKLFSEEFDNYANNNSLYESEKIEYITLNNNNNNNNNNDNSSNSLGERSNDYDNDGGDNNNNDKYDIGKYFKQINTFINIDEYKSLYGDEIYKEIYELYVERNIPEYYEQKYFSDSIKKSVLFDIDKYNDTEFEEAIKEEFINNGVYINNIDNTFYKKENILIMKKILHYFPLLKLINNPSDLKKLKKQYLPLLAHELKIFLFFIVNITGGHFSSVLSSLEIQLLLLYIFNQPYDNVIYDIGHQAYVHKILTGRKLLFLSLRNKKGISGFLNIFESIYDKFGAGHSSTSLSAIQGYYEAEWQVKNKEKYGNGDIEMNDNRNVTNNEESIYQKGIHNNYSNNNINISDVVGRENMNLRNIRNENHNVDNVHIAIIGDGGLTGGMALEALNYISFLNSKILIIYNDNGQVSLPTNAVSISGNRPIGSISDHLHNFVSNIEANADDNKLSKNTKQNNLFENLNYDYIGVVNGNNTEELFKVLNNIKQNKLSRATVLHVRTKKSNDFINSKSPITILHSIKKNEIFSFDPSILNGNIHKENKMEDEKNVSSSTKYDINNNNNSEIIKYEDMFSKETFTDIYTNEMLKYLKKDRNIIFLSPAMLGGSGLLKISERYPNNVYDVGIAEQHSVTFAAAMAMNKKLKIQLCIYSTFLQRAYDQIIHDLNLQNIPLKVIIGRSGLVGEDGATHQGIYDLSYLGTLNNAYIISPSNQVDLKRALRFSYLDKDHSVYIRIPRMNTLSDKYMKGYLNIHTDKENKNVDVNVDVNVDMNNDVDKHSEEYHMDDDNFIKSFIGKSRIIKMDNENNNTNEYYSSKRNTNKKKVCIFNMGSMLFNVINAIKEIEKEQQISDNYSFSIVDMIFLNPLDKNIIDHVIKQNKHQYLITYEDNTIGGFSTHFNNYLIENNYITKHNLYIHNIYLPNEPIEHASFKDQQEVVRMDKDSLVNRINNFLINNPT